MIPTEQQAKALWDKYNMPQQKRIHLTKVAEVAMGFAKKIKVNKKLLLAAALLHDIDKGVSSKNHPEVAVRILREEGMEEVAALVKTHPLHAILDPKISPKTNEQKCLYLADKMVKYEILTVDKRFDLWRAEDLPENARTILDRAYPKVKALEKEIMVYLGKGGNL